MGPYFYYLFSGGPCAPGYAPYIYIYAKMYFIFLCAGILRRSCWVDIQSPR